MMRTRPCICRTMLLAVVMLTLSPRLIRAQNVCAGTGAKLPCVNQPHEGDTQITGKVTVDQSGKPTANVVIMIKVNDAEPQSAQVKEDGTFILAGLSPLNHYNKVEADQTSPPPVDGASPPTTGPVPVLLAPSGTGSSGSGLYTLGLIGINATGSSSSGPSQQYFLEADVIAPLKWLPGACGSNDESDVVARRCWLWFNPRIASVPATSSTTLNSVSSSSLVSGVGGQTIGQITQSFEFQAGGELYVIRPSDAKAWGIGNSWAKSGASMIFGAGGLTPFNSISTAPEFGLNDNLGQQFNQNPTLAKQFPQLAAALCDGFGFSGSTGFTCPTPPTTKPTTVAFVFPNRSRFYRDFYGGFRLRFFYYSGDCSANSKSENCKLTNVYPGTFDVRFGEDESVTGGHLIPLVMTLTGSFPVPGTSGAFRVFGSSYLRLHRNTDTTALILVPTSSFTSLDNPQVVVQPIQRSDQDYYRLGIGVDVFALFAKIHPAKATGTSTQP